MVAAWMGWPRKAATALAVCLVPAVLAGCGPSQSAFPDRRSDDTAPTWSNQPRQSVFGEDGLTLFGGGKRNKAEEANGIGVNAFLWRASLDTIGFMPISSADPFGGVIITDWYAPPETRDERFKATVFIMGRALRADGVRVSAFRQTRDPAGNWIDAAVDNGTGTDLENAILTRARQLRIAANPQSE